MAAICGIVSFAAMTYWPWPEPMTRYAASVVPTDAHGIPIVLKGEWVFGSRVALEGGMAMVLGVLEICHSRGRWNGGSGDRVSIDTDLGFQEQDAASATQ
ncbi:MAG: hypothetical protein U0166_28520 [Acidobacteriota bacterium]